MVARPFRFGIQLVRPLDGLSWAGTARRVEELGYSTLFLPDHFDDQLAPVPALAAAAAATTELRVGALVFDNDYKHPVVLAKEAATIDLLSDGRLELGIGAGWQRTDYDRTGIPYDRPGVRIDRMEEALVIIRGLLAGDTVDFSGEHYTVEGMTGTPRPVQQPGPPLLVGGGGRRVLSIAGREADIVGINVNLAAGEVGPDAGPNATAEATAEKIAWVRDAAGARFDDLELNVLMYVTIVTDDRAGVAAAVGKGFGVDAGQALQIPHAAIGTVEEICADLEARRDTFGLSYPVFGQDAVETMAPVVARLTGR